ncbi:outer membrane protein [Mesorhizobium ciceri]|uniref:outer membrane protein n=1 Tax=Mesorhizobium TaxID=68287 RepID=UPI0012DD4DBB|nr:porin family protein [Mesorhizobium ciceri]
MPVGEYCSWVKPLCFFCNNLWLSDLLGCRDNPHRGNLPIYSWGISMKRLIIASTFLISACGASFAADAVMTEVPAGFNWSGGYVGINAGYGWGSADAVDPSSNFFEEDAGQTFDVSTDGFLGGVQAGYNWQSGAFVYGVEADLGYLGIRGDNFVVESPDNFGSTKLGVYGDLTARLGYAADDC